MDRKVNRDLEIISHAKNFVVKSGMNYQSAVSLSALIQDLKEAMNKGIVHFCFVDRCHAFRTARGTMLPKYFHWRKIDPEFKWDPFTDFIYFDLEYQSIRIFKLENLIGIFKI